MVVKNLDLFISGWLQIFVYITTVLSPLGLRTVHLDGDGRLLDGWWTGKFQMSTVLSVILWGSQRGRYGDGDGRRTGDGCRWLYDYVLRVNRYN